MSSSAKRFALGLAACLLLALSLSILARGASTPIVLNLEGGLGNRTLKACSVSHHYTLFRRGRVLSMNGVVTPAPTASVWLVKVKVKRCSKGRFRTVWNGHAAGRSRGRFRIMFRPRRAGYFFARAYYYGVTPSAKSDKEFFRAI